MPSSHYDETYFAWQRGQGEFGGWADRFKFEPYLRPSDRVLDFGCGGGYLLASLDVRDKLGVEINPAAREQASALGLAVHASTADVPDEWADVVISNHALEHCAHPMSELEALRAKLRPGGRLVCVVPSESVRRTYVPSDQSRHLYTWSPMNLGHLVSEAGYEVEDVREIVHRWPPFGHALVRVGGARLFNVASRLYGRLRRDVSQVRIVARRPVA